MTSVAWSNAWWPKLDDDLENIAKNGLNALRLEMYTVPGIGLSLVFFVSMLEKFIVQMYC